MRNFLESAIPYAGITLAIVFIAAGLFALTPATLSDFTRLF